MLQVIELQWVRVAMVADHNQVVGAGDDESVEGVSMGKTMD